MFSKSRRLLTSFLRVDLLVCRSGHKRLDRLLRKWEGHLFVVGGPCEAPRTFNMLSAESLEPGAPSSRFVVVESAIWDALGRKMQDLRLMVSDDKMMTG